MGRHSAICLLVRLNKPKTGPADGPDFEALRETLKAGVHVVTAPQLFPTPVAVAARMIGEALLDEKQRILEPSAGTGRLLDGVNLALDAWDPRLTTAIEINPALVGALRLKFRDVEVRQADFLLCSPREVGLFDRILMNPPFDRGSDIAHIRHALTFLSPGGRLVALCANGPKQQEILRPLASSWEPLPAGTFAQEGTGVNVVLLTIQR